MIKQTTMDFSENKGKNTVYEKVKRIMERYPETRDNYAYLDFQFYPSNISLSDFFIGLSEGNYSSIESVHRARRMVEEDFPHLRGKTYEKRHIKQHQVCESINLTPIDTIESL